MSRPPAPVERSAADGGKPPEVCPSCGSTTDLVTARIPGVGVVRCCAEPMWCRLRAQAAGQWCTYEEVR